MGIWISPLRSSDAVAPGTRLLEPPSDTTFDTSHLKRDPHRPEIILIPQPSDWPADPLNWSRARKESLYITLVIGSCSVGVIGPLITPALVGFITDFNRSLTDIVALVGYLVLSYGVASLLSVILADVIGRRPLYLVCSLILLISMIWAALANSYASLLWARVLQGIGMGAFGCLGNLTITDLFFLHEQGNRIAAWQLAFNGSVAITPVISGVIIERLGWRVAFWINAALQVVTVVLTVLFLPETRFDRNPPIMTQIELSATSIIADPDAPGDSGEDDLQTSPKAQEYLVTGYELQNESATPAEPYTFVKSLRPWVGQPSDGKLIIRLLRPVVILFTPCVAYSTLLYTFSFSWFVIDASIYAQIFQSPPYNLTPAAVGYPSAVGPFIGVITALIVRGILSDWSARYLSKRNDGFFEPEMRLILVAPGFVAFVIGIFGWAYATASGSSSFWGPAVFIAFVSAGISFMLVAAISYSASAYPARGGDTFGIIMMLKAFWAWGATRFVSTWLVTAGPVLFFLPLAGITMALCVAALPMWYYGKRLRAWSATTRIAWSFE